MRIASSRCSRTATRWRTFKKTIADQGFSISALSCHGNALHPDRDVAKIHQETGRKTVDFSGCPGDSRQAKRPNQVTCPWPPDYLETLKWQWDEVVAPCWTKQAKFAADHAKDTQIFERDLPLTGVLSS